MPLAPLSSIYTPLPTQCFVSSLFLLNPLIPIYAVLGLLEIWSSNIGWSILAGTTILKKTNLPSSSSLGLSVVSQLGGEFCAGLPHAMLTLWLVWACAFLVHIVTTALSSCVQQQCCMQKGFFDVMNCF